MEGCLLSPAGRGGRFAARRKAGKEKSEAFCGFAGGSAEGRLTFPPLSGIPDGRKGGSGMDCTSVGGFIAELRKEKGLTQAELAERVGVT